MPKPLQFEITLTGTFAEALKPINSGLGQTSHRLNEAKGHVELFEGEIGKLSGSLGGLGINLGNLSKGGPIFTFDLAEGLKTVAELVHKVIEGVVDLGKEMVGTAAKTQDLNLAIKLNVGDEQAKQINELAETFQERTRFSAAEIKTALLPLLSQGLGGDTKMLGDLTAAATDYAARTNTGVAGVQTALESFGNIALRGQVNFRMLRNLKISEKDFNEDLAELLNTDVAGAKKLMASGKVDKRTLLSVALNEMQKVQGGALGAPSVESATTFGATLQRLGNLQENLFERIADSPGMKAIQGFLDNFIQVMGGPIGQSLVDKLSGIFSTLFGDLSGPEGLAKVEMLIRNVSTRIEEFIAKFQAAWPGIKKGFEDALPAVEALASTLGVVVSALKALHELSPGKWAQEMKDANPEGDWLGRSEFWKRHFGGATPAPGAPTPPAGEPGEALMSVPKMAGGGMVTRPTLALIGEAGPEAVVPLSDMQSGGGRAPVSVSVELNFHGVTGDAQEIGSAVEQRVRAAIVRLLDEAGHSVGAAA